MPFVLCSVCYGLCSCVCLPGRYRHGAERPAGSYLQVAPLCEDEAALKRLLGAMAANDVTPTAATRRKQTPPRDALLRPSHSRRSSVTSMLADSQKIVLGGCQGSSAGCQGGSGWWCRRVKRGGAAAAGDDGLDWCRCRFNKMDSLLCLFAQSMFLNIDSRHNIRVSDEPTIRIREKY